MYQPPTRPAGRTAAILSRHASYPAAGPQPQLIQLCCAALLLGVALVATSADVPLVIEADSEYVINVFTRWLTNWKATGWRTASRKPVSNQRAIMEVERVLQGREVEWRHVRGHGDTGSTRW
jgi:ribonuclease HI